MTNEQAIEKLNDIRCHVKETSIEEQALVMAINALNQPEIVRCKDCKHLYNVIRGNQGVCQTFNGFSSLVKFNDYCSKAERRTDE